MMHRRMLMAILLLLMMGSACQMQKTSISQMQLDQEHARQHKGNHPGCSFCRMHQNRDSEFQLSAVESSDQFYPESTIADDGSGNPDVSNFTAEEGLGSPAQKTWKEVPKIGKQLIARTSLDRQIHHIQPNPQRSFPDKMHQREEDKIFPYAILGFSAVIMAYVCLGAAFFFGVSSMGVLAALMPSLGVIFFIAGFFLCKMAVKEEQERFKINLARIGLALCLLPILGILVLLFA